MTAREIARVVLKLLGVWFLASGVFGLASVVSWLTAPADIVSDPVRQSLSAFTHTVLLGGTGLYLIWRTQAVVERLFPRSEGATLDVDRGSLLHVGIALVGVAMAAHALPRLCSIAAEAFWQLGAERRQYFHDFVTAQSFSAVYNLAALAIGVAIALRSKLVAGYLDRTG